MLPSKNVLYRNINRHNGICKKWEDNWDSSFYVCKLIDVWRSRLRPSWIINATLDTLGERINRVMVFTTNILRNEMLTIPVQSFVIFDIESEVPYFTKQAYFLRRSLNRCPGMKNKAKKG